MKRLLLGVCVIALAGCGSSPLDVRGKVTFNGKLQKLAPGTGDVARACKKGGWKTFTSPSFKNQGQCVKNLVHGRNAAKKTA